MRYFNICAAISLTFFQIGLSAQEAKTDSYYGESFKMDKAEVEIGEFIESLQSSDSIQTQLTGTIKEVCQAKGCWMKVALETEDEVFVKFKDYGFFVPTDSANKNVVLNGIVFTEEISVDEQKHYAKDRGETPEEIAQIKTTKKMLRFEADGVLIKNPD